MLLKEKAEALREEAEEMISVPSIVPQTADNVTVETNTLSSLTTDAFDSQFDADLQNMDSQTSLASL